MARRSKPAGNKRQRERDKQRKREQKAIRKQLRKEGLLGGDDPEDENAEPGEERPEDPDAVESLDSPGVPAERPPAEEEEDRPM